MKTVIHNTGLIVTMLSAAVVIPGGFLSKHVPSWELRNEETESALLISANRGSINYSDCLWYTARNHGFYQVQRNVAYGEGGSQNLQLWKQFIESIGQDECGLAQHSMAELTLAVAVTVHDADQHFLRE